MTLTLDELATPALILDRLRLERNIARMTALAADLGVALRPHLKTPKSLPVGELMRRGGVDRVTVSTLREAEHFLGAGFSDVFYAVALAPQKVARLAALQRAGGRLSGLVDTLEGAELCAAAAQAEGIELPLWVEIDVDGYRSGVAPDGPDLVRLVELLCQNPATRFAGVMSYGGVAYHEDAAPARAAIAEAHRQALLAARARLAAAGLPCPALSFGATPAVTAARSLEGIDEVRCGIFAFQDLLQAGIGACDLDDIAVSVLATVISASPARNQIIVDAGALALSKDVSTAGRAFEAGLGLVCDAAGRRIADLFVARVSQELGVVCSRSGAPLPFAALPMGARVRILPNHADMTAAAYEAYHVLDGQGRVEAIWPRANQW